MLSAQIKITSAIRKTETLTGLQIKIKNSLGKQLSRELLFYCLIFANRQFANSLSGTGFVCHPDG